MLEKVAGINEIETLIVKPQIVGISLNVPDGGGLDGRCYLRRGSLQSDDLDIRRSRCDVRGQESQAASDFKDVHVRSNLQKFDELTVRQPIQRSKSLLLAGFGAVDISRSQLLPVKGTVDLGKRNGAGEPDKRPMLGDFRRCLQEPGPCRAGQRAANADPTHASLA